MEDKPVYENEEKVDTINKKLVEELLKVKQAIYDRIILGSLANDSKESQITENAIYYEYIMRRLCLDLDLSLHVSNMVPFDELPRTNLLIKQLKEDKEIGLLMNTLVETYRSLSKSENAIYNKRYIQEALINYPWPYEKEGI